jgi:hypothetical protein
MVNYKARRRRENLIVHVYGLSLFHPEGIGIAAGDFYAPFFSIKLLVIFGANDSEFAISQFDSLEFTAIADLFAA